MTAKFKVGQWISKEDVLKIGEVRWEKFREKYKSEHTTTRDFTSCGLFENHTNDYSYCVRVYSDGDLAWDDSDSIGKDDKQITYETILEYIGEKEMNFEVPEGATHFVPESGVYYAQWLKKEDDFKHYYKCIREDGIVDQVWQRSGMLSFPKDAIEIKEKEMNKFDLKTQPWFIRVDNEEESKAAQEWLFEQGMTWRVGDTNIRIGHIYRYLMNISSVGVIDKDGFMHSSRMCDGMLPEYEIKLSFETTTKVVSVIFPETEELVELNGKKYKKSDLEAALSKLNPTLLRNK